MPEVLNVPNVGLKTTPKPCFVHHAENRCTKLHVPIAGLTSTRMPTSARNAITISKRISVRSAGLISQEMRPIVRNAVHQEEVSYVLCVIHLMSLRFANSAVNR